MSNRKNHRRGGGKRNSHRHEISLRKHEVRPITKTGAKGVEHERGIFDNDGLVAVPTHYE